MFASVSWANYLVVVTLFTSVYYLITVLFFYSRDLQGLITGKREGSIQEDPGGLKGCQVQGQDDSGFTNMEAEAYAIQDSGVSPAEDSFPKFEQLVAHLKATVGEVKVKKYSKDDFILLLQLVLKEYPAFKGSPFESAMQQLIYSECKKQDSIALTEEDIRHLFDEVA